MDEQLTFGEWLEDALISSGMQKQDLAELLGVDPSTVTKWTKNENRPRTATCDQIAAALGIDRSEVRERADRPKVVELAARLEMRTGVRASVTVHPTIGIQPVDMTYLTIMGTAAADMLRESWGPGDLYPVPRRELQGLSSPVLFVVKGDCMEPRDINDGDIVILEQDIQPKEGDVVAVSMGDEATLKEYFLEGDDVVLRAAKAGYPPIRIKQSDQGAHLIGVVKGSFRWKRH